MLTLLFFLPPPPPPLLLFEPLNPLTSSSRTMDGGLTFFPHPLFAAEAACCGSSVGPALSRTGGATSTALADTVGGALMTADWENAARAAPVGMRGATAFGMAFFLTGAKARAADQPFFVRAFVRSYRAWRGGCFNKSVSRAQLVQQ